MLSFRVHVTKFSQDLRGFLGNCYPRSRSWTCLVGIGSSQSRLSALAPTTNLGYKSIAFPRATENRQTINITLSNPLRSQSPVISFQQWQTCRKKKSWSSLPDTSDYQTTTRLLPTSTKTLPQDYMSRTAVERPVDLQRQPLTGALDGKVAKGLVDEDAPSSPTSETSHGSEPMDISDGDSLDSDEEGMRTP